MTDAVKSVIIVSVTILVNFGAALIADDVPKVVMIEIIILVVEHIVSYCVRALEGGSCDHAVAVRSDSAVNADDSQVAGLGEQAPPM